MPRTYKKKLGSRAYEDYTEEILDRALTAIVDGRLSLRAASEKFKIPYGTIFNKYHGRNVKKPGAQPVFSENEEESILKSVAKCGEWGFPLTIMDLRMFAKILLDRKGRTVAKFPNNLPGVDWAYSLLKRHKNNYSRRVAANIKRARASVSPESIKEYFKNLEEIVKDVPASNIFNYDESNMSDDPGKKIGIYRRGVKYPEKAINFSKSSTTVMVCGSADGVLLPPYIIYKSIHLYNTWKEQAPCGLPCCDKPCCSQGSRFNRTNSGWIDAPSFRDWFMTSFLPHAKRLTGRKVLIGDNLASHLDEDVLQLCAQNEIDFVCLVPNSTHLLQPLDVAFFRPMKTAWRQILMNWKLQHSKATTVPKDTFPSLLRKALFKMDEASPKPNSLYKDISSGVRRSMMSGFCATGIYPFNIQKVLDRLPKEEMTEQEVDRTLTDFLKQSRYGNTSNQPARKKKRLDVQPGKSIATREEEQNVNLEETTQDPIPSTSQVTTQTKISEVTNTSDDDTETASTLINTTQKKTLKKKTTHDIDRQDGNEVSSDEDLVEREDVDLECTIGRYVLARFFTRRGKKTYRYVCQITEIDPLLVEGFKSAGNKTRFTRIKNDISEIEVTDIVSLLPKPVEKNDYIEFPFDINVAEQ